MDKKIFEECEKQYKYDIFFKLYNQISKQGDAIDLITKNATNLGQSQVKIDNAAITLNNKLVELLHIFKRAGISMFARENERYDYVDSSFLGDAIIFDLLDKLAKATDKLIEYSKKIEEVTNSRIEKTLARQNKSSISKFFSQIKGMFVPEQSVDLSFEEEQSILDSLFQEYRNTYLEIFNYNLEDNLVQSLVKNIVSYSASVVPGLLEEDVIPDLKKLGLEHLVSKLQEALIEEYKKNLTDFEIQTMQDENRYLFIPDFSRKKEKGDKSIEELHDIVPDTTEINKQNQQLMELVMNYQIEDSGIDGKYSSKNTKEILEMLKKEIKLAQENTAVHQENDVEVINFEEIERASSTGYSDIMLDYNINESDENSKSR